MKKSLKLVELRLQVDAVDREISSLLLRRFKLADQILEEKRKVQLPVRDVQREKEIFEGLSPVLASSVWRSQVLLIFHYILKVSCEYMHKKSDERTFKEDF